MKIIDNVLKIIKPDTDGKNVLEVACGSADLSVAMSPAANAVKCIDLVDFRLNTEISHCKNVEFSVMDAKKMSFSDSSFDTVVIYNALYHIKDELAEILSECRRVVKRGGAIYLISSFSIDRAIIENTVIPALQNAELCYILNRFNNLVIVRICV